MSAFIDSERIKEHLMECADRLDDLGFDGMEEMLNGNGPVGKAYRRLCGEDELETICKYLKSVAAAFKAQNEQTPGQFYIQQAMMALDQTWKAMQTCIELPVTASAPGQDARSAQRSVMQLQAPGVPTAARLADGRTADGQVTGLAGRPMRRLGPAVPVMRR